MAGDWEAIRDWSRRERARRGWTQADLARAANVSLKTISDLESGKPRTRLNKLPEIELAFGLEPGTAQQVLNGTATIERDPRWAAIQRGQLEKRWLELLADDRWKRLSPAQQAEFAAEFEAARARLIADEARETATLDSKIERTLSGG